MLVAISGGLAAALIAVLMPVLRRAEFLDVPNHRSSHVTPIPRGGGIAVIASIALSLLLVSGFGAWPLVLAAITLAGVGLVDDLRSLSGGVRLAAQFVASAWVSLWIAGVTDVSIAWWGVTALIVVLVGYVNAFNFMDGVNGISALTAAATGGYWALVGAGQDLASIEVSGLVLAGAALGFLPFNAPRARVFLGDVGSYGLGLFIGGLSVLAWAEGVHWLMALAPLVVYGVDTGWVLLKRTADGKPLLEAHREHVYQRLVDGGWSHLASAGLCVAVASAVCAVAAASQAAGMSAVGLVVIAVVALGYLATPRLILGAEGRS